MGATDHPTRSIPSPIGTGPALRLSAGIVAFNEERSIGSAIGSLMAQRLPEGTAWEGVWVVASGCTDRTVSRVEAIARTNPLIHLVVEPDRGGKSRALDAVFRRANGQGLVLMNADATAEPGSVAALLAAAQGRRRPFAVMGRPVVATPGEDTTVRLMRLQWELHHALHQEVIARGLGNHLSDELLLVSLPEVPGIPTGIVNDGSYFGAWLTRVGGEIGYAPEARVRVAIPTRIGQHVRQRRRIRAGHAQVASTFGRAPSTLPMYAREFPSRAFSLVARTVRGHPGGWIDFGLLGAAEVSAAFGATWDRLRGAPNPVGWRRVETHPATPAAEPTPTVGPAPRDAGADLEPRIRGLLEVAARFGTGVPLGELLDLLPTSTTAAGWDDEELERWLVARPALARVEQGYVLAPTVGSVPDRARRVRGARYRRAAQRIVRDTWARWLPLTDVIGVTGSTAFGEPEEGDDVDFFVVTKQGALWLFLALAYLSLRFQPPVVPGEGRVEPCLNTVLDGPRAREEIGRPRDLLFAREALTLEPIRGATEYRALLTRGRWMAAILPRLYARRASGVPAPSSSPVPWPLKGLNLVLYPWVASYLQLRALAKNHALRRGGAAPEESFRISTQLGRMTLSSRKFDRLRALLASSASPPGEARPPAVADPAGAEPLQPSPPLPDPSWSSWTLSGRRPDEGRSE